jgi:sulfatase maturation enzyme AslB (radical SAM superfamily)
MTKNEFISKRRNLGTMCQAPHTNLYLGHKGIASVCCANRSFTLGQYPDQTLLQIWNGEKIKELRKELDNFSFKKGCFQCKYFLDMEKFKLLKITHYDAPDNVYKGLEYPYRLDLELDNTCNLECKMCNGVFSSSIRKNRENRPAYISPYYNNNFLKELTPFLLNAKQINFYGGEPFLIKIYSDIFDILLDNKSQANIFIQTNGTVFSSKVEKILKKLNLNLGVSIDGGTKEVYENIRKNSSYEKVIENCNIFKNILKEKNKKFFISTVLCKENIHDLLNIAVLANKFETDVYFQHVVHPVNMSLENMSFLELKYLVDFFENSLKSIVFKFLPKNSNYYSLLDAVEFVKNIYKQKIENKKEIYDANNAFNSFFDDATIENLREYDKEKYNLLEKAAQDNNLKLEYLEDFLKLFSSSIFSKNNFSKNNSKQATLDEFKQGLEKYLKHVV